jgi:enoyl-CoA hydratase/carnithine racemase
LPSTDVLAAAQATSARLAALPPGAVQAGKALMRGANRAAIASTIEQEAAVFGAALQSAEAKAAFAAFLGR